jgi:NADPH:quinone reductase-like Zn-dependent oxidoreductase
MRAMGCPEAGALDRLGLVDVDAPSAGRGEVVVRVVAAAVNPADLKVLRGEFAGRVLHARTKPIVAGYDLSGVVLECGDGVDDLRPGDEVFGFLAYASKTRQGTFAERVALPSAELARKPAGVSHATAAASATPGLSALQALRDDARVQHGHRVLVIGAAGGVGSVAVGIAKALGAHVTGVCSTGAIELVRSLGADEVIDRRTTDVRSLAGPFDAIFDVSASYTYTSMRHALTSSGAFVTTLPSAGWLAGKLMTLASRRRCHMLVVKGNTADLARLAAWIAAEVKVPIDVTYPVRELDRALARFAKGNVRGRLAIDVEDGW